MNILVFKYIIYNINIIVGICQVLFINYYKSTLNIFFAK